MHRLVRLLLLHLLFSAALIGAALAQEKSFVVPDCSSTGLTYVAGETRPQLVDTTGRTCSVGSGSTTVTSVVPGVAATSLGKAEDAAHVSGDTGVMALGVRTDTLSTPPATTDGDYIPFITDSRGAIWVTPSGNVAAGAADSGNPVKIGGIYNSTAVTITTGQRGNVALSNTGSVRVKLGGDQSSTFDGATANWIYGNNDATQTGFAPYWVMPGTWNGTTLDQQFTCTSSAVVSVTAGNTTELVALTASKVIRVCSFVLTESLAGTAQFVYGTGTNCGTGTTNLTGAMAMATSGTLALSGANSSLLRTASANALCLAAVTGNITGFVTYGKF